MDTKKGYLDWQIEQYEKEMFMGVMKRSSSSCITDLLQNCDLPPPLNVFAPEEGEKRISKASTAISMPQSLTTPPPIKKVDQCEDELGLGLDRGEENPSLLRALQLSQTRAREAEKKASVASTRNEQMTALFLEESLRLYAHRQWVRLLEVENSMLREEKRRRSAKEEERREEEVVTTMTWCLGLALCLGIAGMGIALGRCLF